MFDERPTHSDRRGFLTRTAAGAAMAALATLPTWVEAQAPMQAPEIDADKMWLRGVNTKCRQFFETARMDSMIPFHHVANYFAAWRATRGIKPDDVMAVVGIFGFAVPVLFGDAMWEKYSFGKTLNLTDASTGQPYIRNPYLTPRNGELFGSDSVTPAALQGLGARIILCNNAFTLFVAMSSAATNQAPPVVRAEMLRYLAPRVTLVPAMVQAVEQAQRAGLTYMKNS